MSAGRNDASVLRWMMLRERVALERREQLLARVAEQVVEPVAELQVLDLRLEHVVERSMPSIPPNGLEPLGEAADPEVDVLETGDGLAADVRPGARAVHEVQPVGRGDIPGGSEVGEALLDGLS